ncbi:hypothetical protein ACJW31_05G131900 [Castanea mollissima]
MTMQSQSTSSIALRLHHFFFPFMFALTVSESGLLLCHLDHCSFSGFLQFHHSSSPVSVSSIGFFTFGSIKG